MLKVAWENARALNTIHTLLGGTYLRLVGTCPPYNKRSYDTTSDEETNRKICYKESDLYGPCN